MSKKLAVTAAAIGAVSLLLTACGGGSADGDASGSKGSQNGSSVADEIKFWVMGDSTDNVQEIVDNFTAETGIKVNMQGIPWSAAHDKLLTAVASNEGPDVVQMGTTGMAEFSDAGALLDMSEYVASVPEFAPDNFFPGAVTTTYFHDQYFGIPWYTETRVLFYRTDLLESVGYPEAPATWDELSDAAEKLAQRGPDMYGVGLDPKEPTLGFMFGRQNGSPLFNDNMEPVLNQPDFVEAIAWMDTFYKNGWAPSQDLGLDTSQTFGEDGMVPMYISGPWMIETTVGFEEDENIVGKWGTAVLPAGKDSNMSLIGGANLSIWNNSKHVDEAVDFIKYMIKPESLATYGQLPSLQSAWDNEVFTSNPYLVAVQEQLGNAEPMPLIPEWDSVAQAYLESMEQIVVGNADIQTTMDTLNKTVAGLISN